ncbi:MAG: Mor transcription activator family protein [Methylococcaceae bacterium]
MDDCIESFTDISERAFLSVGFPSEESAALAQLVVVSLQQNWGGMIVYFKKGHAAKLSARNKLIYQEWLENKSIRGLAQKHGISSARIYKVIELQKPV